MGRAVLLDCLPWLMILAGLVAILGLLVRASGARPSFGRLRRLHGDQSGGVQSLSFVLTLPFFILVIGMIVQVSQVMIGTVVVHYAAFAAARSAIVWIPARMVSSWEPENCISRYALEPDQPMPTEYAPYDGGLWYTVNGNRLDTASAKYMRIHLAAVMACAAIGPSRDGVVPASPEGPSFDSSALVAVYHAMVPSATENWRVSPRLSNKLAYASGATKTAIRFYHPGREPPLAPPPRPIAGDLPEDVYDFRENELGWQDSITVKVEFDMPLLSGLGKMLFRHKVEKIEATDGDSYYVYPLEAEATLGNEGEKPLIPYHYYHGI